MPETSVVIRTFNEERPLPRLFDGLAEQQYTDFDVIVVDSGSVDRSRDIASQRGARVIRIPQHDFTFGHSLNVGLRSSSGRFAVIVSAHTKPHDCLWLASLIEPLRDDQTALVYGRQTGGEDSKYSEARDFERTFGAKRAFQRADQYFANNANSAIRRDLWEQHPFDETLPGLEDIEWARHWMTRDFRVLYEPSAAIFHLHDETWTQVRRRYYREALAAQWLGFYSRRHIPGLVAQDAGRLLGDLKHAAVSGRLLLKTPEIVRFRWEKAAGTANGIWHGVQLDNPLQHQQLFFDKGFQALVIRGPGRASLEEVDMPLIKPGDVLVKVAYEGICATDLEIYEGRLGYYKTGAARYPIVPGHELSGRVAAVGANVKDIAEGTRVVAECIQSCGECAECRRRDWTACQARQELGVIGLNGGYAEYVLVPGHFIHQVPDDISLKRASLCEPLAVVLKGLKRLAVTWGSSDVKDCAVMGAGTIGHLCARVLDMWGHRVTIYDQNPLRLSYLNGSRISVSRTLDDLGRFDTLIDATGAADVLEAMLHKSGPGCTILLLGLPYARREFNFEGIVSYDKTIVGSVGSSAAEFEEALDLLRRLELSPFFERNFSLDEFNKAWRTFRAQEHLKIQLAIDRGLDIGQPASKPFGTVASADARGSAESQRLNM